jgi:hypothetical protein
MIDLAKSLLLPPILSAKVGMQSAISVGAGEEDTGDTEEDDGLT